MGKTQPFIGNLSTTVRLEIPAGKAGTYRVSQQDDTASLPRRRFLHRPPLTMTLQARVSGSCLPGTWGFGFWNDPFTLGIGVKGSGIHLPALPQAAWFFYGSPKNDLSFQAKEPANGLMASVFSSKFTPSIVLPLALPVLPLLLHKSTAKLVRKFASQFIQDEFVQLEMDSTAWHTYRLDWLPESVCFYLDGDAVFTTTASPKPPLGLVIWIDNQYAVFSADGTVQFGTEENPMPAWMEIRELVITTI